MSYLAATGVHGRPGRAIIEIGYALQVDPLLLTIQKVGRDPRYLAADGSWLSDPQTLQPLGVERAAGCTRILVGPAIVNNIGDNERIRVEILSAGFAGELVWSDIAPSAESDTPSIFAARLAPTPVRQPLPSPPAEPEPAVTEVKLGPATDGADMEKDSSPPGPSPRPRPWLPWALSALLVVLLVAGGADWYFQLWPWPPRVDGSAGDLQRLRARLDAMMAADGDAGQILDGGLRLLGSADNELCSFGLGAVRFATRKSSPAQFEFAKLFDPRNFHARPCIDRASPLVAAEYYRDASKDLPAAVAELDGLCDKLGQPMDGVDEEARASTTKEYCNK